MNGKFKGFSALTLGLALGFTAGAAHAAAPASSPGTAIAIMQASAALQADNCTDALKPLNQLWNDPYLENSDPSLAADYRLRLVACTAQVTGLNEALSLSTDNITRKGSGLTAFDMHAFLQLMASQPAAAADTLDLAMTRFPDTAPDLSDMTLLGTLAVLHDLDPARALALLDHAETVRWQSHSLPSRPGLGLLRIEGLRAAVQAGKAPLAALYRADIRTEAFTYIVSQGDGELSSAAVAPDDVTPILAGQIHDAGAAVQKDPTDLATLGYLITLERANGQSDAALKQLDGILALIGQYGVQNFQNPETYGELIADKALLLSDQGRYSDAVAIFKAGEAALGAGAAGDLDVAYVTFLVDRGADAAALDATATFDVSQLSDGQKISLIAENACAYGHEGDHTNYRLYLSAIGDAGMRLRPKLCAGDGDGAAADLISVISVPEARSGAIAAMQDGAPGLPLSDSDRTFQAATAGLKKRADVLAAVAAANILVRTWPIRY